MFTNTIACLFFCLNQAVTGDGALLEILKSSLGNDPKNKAMVSAVSLASPSGPKVKVLLLYGTVDNQEVQFSEIEKGARSALENAGKWNFDRVDASRLVRRSEGLPDQVLNFLKADTKEFSDKDQFAVTQLGSMKDSKLVLIGKISSESARERCARECEERLKAAIQRKDIQMGAFEIDASTMNRSPSKYYDTILASLANSVEGKEQLGKGFSLVYADVVPSSVLMDKQVARIAGVSPNDVVTRHALKLITTSVKNAYPELVDVDSSAVFSGQMDENKAKIVDSLMPTRSDFYLVTQAVQGGKVSMVGKVPDLESAQKYLDIVSRINFVSLVEQENVLVGSQDVSSLNDNATDPARALRRRDPQMLLRTSAPLITTPNPYSNTVLEGWYYRAAAHVMLGDDEMAVGDLKAARLLEKKYFYDFSYKLFEGFQGGQRERLDQLYRYASAN